jgi:hypothetical protein
VTSLPEFSGGASTPWIGDVIRARAEDVVSFRGTDYPIRMVAAADTLVWSVPERTARAAAGKTSFESGLARFAITPSVEVWRFPKLEQEPVHEVVLLLDREQGTAASVELVLRSGKSGLRPDIRILRGTLAGYPRAYGGFAFPRYKPGTPRVSFGADGGAPFLDFDRTGQPSAFGRADAASRASGHALLVAPEVWAVAWRTTGSVAFALIDEGAGVVNGETLTVGRGGATIFGMRAGVIRSA